MSSHSSPKLNWMVALLGILLIASADANASEAVRLRVVATSGEVASSGYGHDLSSFKFDAMGGATINDRGDVAYFALTDHHVDGLRRGGVWMDPIHPGQPNKFLGILDDVMAPDDPLGRRFLGVQLPILSDRGTGLATEFYSDRDEGSGVYLANDHYFGPLLIPGDQAPGLLPGELVLTATGVLFTSSGIGLLSAHTNHDLNGLWRFSGESLQLIAVNRSPIAELPGFQYTGTALRGKINDLGTALVYGQITNGAKLEAALVQIATNGERTLVAQTGVGGTSVPGAPAGSTLEGIDGFQINNGGTIVIDASFVTPDNVLGKGIWLQLPNLDVKPVVTTGMSTPDGAAEFEWLNATNWNHNLNEKDVFGFEATLRRNDGTAVNSAWIGGAHGIELLATQGDQAPGFPLGVRFQRVGMPTLNDLGTVFVGGQLEGPGINLGANDAIFYGFAGSELSPLIWQGQQLELSSGDVRRVKSFSTILAEAGRENQVNNRNEVALGVSFDDGSSAVLVFSIIPEPSSLAIVFATAVAWLLVRRI